MSVLKQLALCLVLLVAGAALWILLVPSSRDVLAGLGIDVPALAATPPEQAAGGGGPGAGSAAAPRAAPTVVAAPARRATINDQLRAIGTGRAVQSVAVHPFASGRLTAIEVRSGQQVRAGDVLARLDSEVETIAVDRARITLADAQSRLERAEALRNANTGTVVALNEAKFAVDNAQLQLRESELALERRAIVAPIDGMVGILPVNVGDYVTSATQIVQLDDRSELLVDFWVPERLANAVAVGAPVTATSIARPGSVFQGEVSAVDNRIDPESRTLHVQARLENRQDTLRAGMSFEISMRFPGDTYPAVDPLAIQWTTEGAHIWQVREGKAERVPVRIVQRNADAVLVDADIPDGRQIVTEGIHAVREGAEVVVANQPRPEPVAATQSPAGLQ